MILRRLKRLFSFKWQVESLKFSRSLPGFLRNSCRDLEELKALVYSANASMENCISYEFYEIFFKEGGVSQRNWTVTIVKIAIRYNAKKYESKEVNHVICRISVHIS